MPALQISLYFCVLYTVWLQSESIFTGNLFHQWHSYHKVCGVLSIYINSTLTVVNQVCNAHVQSKTKLPSHKRVCDSCDKVISVLYSSASVLYLLGWVHIGGWVFVWRKKQSETELKKKIMRAGNWSCNNMKHAVSTFFIKTTFIYRTKNKRWNSSWRTRWGLFYCSILTYDALCTTKGWPCCLATARAHSTHCAGLMGMAELWTRVTWLSQTCV